MPLQPKLGRFTTAAPVLVNFDQVDIANGTGYEDYFFIESEDSSGKDYHLTPNNDFSNSFFLQKDGAGSIDNDFDLTPFVFPRTINGTVLISLAVIGQSSNGTWTVELYKVNDAGETQIGSAVVSPAASDLKMLYMRMPIVNELIPAGEQLRVRVLMTNNAGGTIRWGIDPAGRTDPSASLTTTTTSKISIPYKLDV